VLSTRIPLHLLQSDLFFVGTHRAQKQSDRGQRLFDREDMGGGDLDAYLYGVFEY